YINAKGEPKPMLAKSWEVSDEGRTLKLNLIDDWEYHDGTAFDAESVVKNLDRHRAKGSFNASALRPITDVKAVDEHTVIVESDGAAGSLINAFGGSPGMMMSPKVMDDDSQASKPTGGSGPYKMTNYVSGDRVEYEAVDDYWDPD